MSERRAWLRSAIALGFALGGFFDGILLHQILQWHHLLSLVPGVDSLRAQVLWDGYFHALMYLVAATALWGLWRARGEDRAAWGPALPGALLLGFGLWHAVDAVLSHWLLGIHRIRLDSPNPLAWDLIWLTAFGLAPGLLGWRLVRKRRPAGGLRGPAAAIAALTLLTGAMAAWSLSPPPDQRLATIVFAPGVTPAEAMNALVETRSRLVWSDPRLTVVVAEVPAAGRTRLYRRGALLVSGSGPAGGCLAWSRGATA